MILLRNDGKTYEEIMGFISCSCRSVAHWCIHGNPDNLESFKAGRAQGNYRKATPEYIAELLNVIEQEPIAFGYEFGRWTESGFSLRVIRRKQWGKNGKRKALSGKRSQGRVNLMGGLRYNDRKQNCYVIEQGNSVSFHANLKNLNGFVKREWVENGNIESEFEEKAPQILVVLDNASYHKKESVIEQLTSECPNIELRFLPPYSPDYNLLPLVWHSCKEFIAHRLFKSVDELRELLDRLTNQGELDIQWQRNVKNKGNAVPVN